MRALALLGLALIVAGCGERPIPPSVRTWVMGVSEPAFDPGGPPDPARTALERMMTAGLVALDSSGTVQPAGAERWVMSPDSLRYVFRIRGGLSFADGSPCTSHDFRAAIEGAISRRDHATYAWLLRNVEGMDRVRPGREPPEIGIDAPDDSTLEVRLAHPDSLLLEVLALPAVSGAWKDRSATAWGDDVGTGPCRPVSSQPGRLLQLAARPGAAAAVGADTVTVRFGVDARRIRSLLRSGIADLVWPLAPGLLHEPLPERYRVITRAAVPPRKLLLVIRADLPPTTRLAARHALAHGINATTAARALGARGVETETLLAGAGRFDYPSYDADEVRYWLQRGSFGKSFHVLMTYDADGAAAEVARALQDDWARFSIYVELLPLRGERFERECLHGRSQLLLVDAQSLLVQPSAELVRMVVPRRGPPVGTFTTGWKTREFDRWIEGRSAPRIWLRLAQRRIALENTVLPLADLPWTWIELSRGPGASFHPRYGPGPFRVERKP